MADPQLRLFCFPYAGGGASAFREWEQELPGAVEVLAVQPPGREGRLAEAPFTRIPALVQALVAPLRAKLEAGPSVPCAFFGHSLGALVAYELTLELRRRGEPGPDHLLVSGSRAPHCTLPDDPVHVLRGEAFKDRLRVLGGTPPQVLENEELMNLFTPLLLADFELSETYRHGVEPLNVPISAFAGTDDPEVSLDRVEAWREQAGAGFHLDLLPGDHFFLHSAQTLLLGKVWSELVARGTVAQP